MAKQPNAQPVLFLLLPWLCIFFFSQTGFTQTRQADSLKMVALNTKDSGERFSAFLRYFEQWYNIQRDTLYQYAAEAYHFSQKNANVHRQAEAALALSRSYMHWGWIDSAIGYLEPYAGKGSDSFPPGLYLEMNRQLALAHGGVSRYAKALELLYSNCNFAEKNKNAAGFAASANTLVSVLLNMGRYTDAGQWLKKARSALAIPGESFPHVMASVFTNYGGYFLAINQPERAGKYFDSATALLDKQENLSIRPILFRHQAQYFLEIKSTEKAGAMLKEMIAARGKIAGSFSFIEENLEIAAFYEQNGFLEEAIKICEQNLLEGDVYDAVNQNKSFNNDIKNRLPYYNRLAGLYKKAGDQEKYTAALEWLVAAKDSLYSSNNAEAIADLQAKYELSEKERSIARQKIEIWQKNLYLFAGGGLSLMIIGGMVYGFFRYRKNQRLRMQSAMAEEKAKALVAQREAAEQERKRIAADLHDNLGAYGAAIKNNVAQIRANNPPADKLLVQMEENVRHMVDELGNTIWVLNKSEQHLTSLYDSIKTWSRRLLNSYSGIKCRFEEDIENDILLTPNQSLQWLYIAQEAINNAVKHSGTGQLKIVLVANIGWKLMVKDEGRGLGSGAIGGQGLNSIKDRCAKMGWHAEWMTPSAGGTIFELKNLS